MFRLELENRLAALEQQRALQDAADHAQREELEERLRSTQHGEESARRELQNLRSAFECMLSGSKPSQLPLRANFFWNIHHCFLLCLSYDSYPPIGLVIFKTESNCALKDNILVAETNLDDSELQPGRLCIAQTSHHCLQLAVLHCVKLPFSLFFSLSFCSRTHFEWSIPQSEWCQN